MLQRYPRRYLLLSAPAILISLLLILALAGCDGFDSANTPDTSSTTPPPSSSSTSGSPGTDAGATPTSAAGTSTSQSTAFKVTSLSVSVDHPTFTGICGNTMKRLVTGIIHAPANTPGGKVTYHWAENGGGVFPTQTVTFAAGQTSQTVTETTITGANWGNGTQLWLTLNVTAPNTLTSVHDTFSFTCQRKITSIKASVNSATACNAADHTFAFKATITVSPGPGQVTLTYHWLRSDHGTGPATTITLASGQTSTTVTNSWSLFAPIQNGSYWEEVAASAPNGYTSNHAAFSIIAC